MKLKSTLAALAILATPSLCLALGMRIADQDAEATARGDAFVATADNPSAIYYNPAGISQLSGENLLLGTYGIYLQSKYTSAGQETRTKDQPQAVPQIYYTYAIKDTPFTLGLGVYCPYGFGLSYPDSNPFRVFALKGSVEYLTVNPVISWKINKTLSVAAGMTVNYAEADLAQGLAPFQGNRFQFKGTGAAVGFNLGVMWQPTPQHSFGVSYHSATSMDLHGTSTLAFAPTTLLQQHATSSDFTFPDFIIGGYSYRPTPDWNFEADVDWTNWHDLKTVTLNQQVGAPVPLNFNWQSSFFYEFGATHYFADNYHLSAGYIYSQDYVPTGSSFSPLIPDSARHIFTTGIGWKKDRYSWDFAYEFAYGPPRTIVGASSTDGESVNGEYRYISHALTISFGYHF